jgi:hypothetical protein
MSVFDQALMRFDPATGKPNPEPKTAKAYREHHGKVAFLYNPYTGKLRDARDIGSDIYGHLIAPIMEIRTGINRACNDSTES